MNKEDQIKIMYNNNKYSSKPRTGSSPRSGFGAGRPGSTGGFRKPNSKPNFTSHKPTNAPRSYDSNGPRSDSSAPRSYSNTSSQPRYGSRPQYGGSNSSNSQGGSFGESRSQFRGGGGAFQPRSGFAPNRGSGRPQGRKIKFFNDINKFIKKAAPITQEAYAPTHSFEDFDLLGPVKENIITRGYTQPTAIQDQAIKPIMAGKDVIGLANTGTGKTAAFLIPIINNIFKNRDKKALIIAPTRELAVQINTEFRNFAQGLRVYSTIITGGANMYRQISEIRRNPHVVIATPGRLKDLVKQNVLHLEDFSIFVLDEVDLMVDIGFIDDIKFFLSYLPKERQSLFFSATLSPKINDILRRFVNDPITVSVKMQDTADNVEQDVVRVISRDKKVEQLHDLLISDGFDKVLIFGRTKHGVENLYKELETRGFKVGALHGNKNQGARRRVLESFKRDEISILLATDVASRGLDIDNVTHVINYELPESYEDYIHRIGRTGRANKRGNALTFVD